MKYLSLRWLVPAFLSMLHPCLCLAVPLISFPEAGISLGNVLVGTNTVGEIELHNIGSVPVSVSRIKACCGAVAELKPRTIEPDAVAVLSVSFVTKSAGAFAKKVQIFCNDPERPMIGIPVTGVAVEAPVGVPSVSRCGMVAWLAVLSFTTIGLLLGMLRLKHGRVCGGERFTCCDVVMPCLTVVSRFSVGAIFVYAGSAKLCDVSAFADLVARYELLPGFAVRHFAFFVPPIELFFGGMLILRIWIRSAASVISVLLAVFIVALVQAFVRGLDVSCGCFGGVSTDAHADVVIATIRDVVLLMLASFLIFTSGRRR